MRATFFLLLLLVATPLLSAEERDTQPFQCTRCAQWNAPGTPFLLAPNSWYVGPEGLSSVLVDTGNGLLLIDAGLPQSAAPIATRIRQLGFDLKDLRWIANSHAHFDHAGGIAALARWSGATVLASARGVEALASGAVPADDPQAGYAPENGFPPVTRLRAVADGEELALGQLTLTAIYSAGHTPGSTSWSWPACDARTECVTVVYADSLTSVSSPEYRYLDHPDYLADFRRSIARVGALDCDIVVAAHPDAVSLFERRDSNRLRDADGCRRYAERAEASLQKRLAAEAGR